MVVPRSVPFLMLWHELDRLRTESGVSAERAARELGCRVSKISRIHLGQSRISAGDTRLLAELYGASPELTADLVEMARGLSTRQEPAAMLADLERHSSRIRVRFSEIIPGLLQTERYIRALYETPSLDGRAVDVEAAVRTRLARQRILTEPDPPISFGFILSESALRREYGNRAVMEEQWARLLEVGRLPNVRLQVLPFVSAEPVGYLTFNFELLHIPGPGMVAPLDYVHIESYRELRFLDDQESVAGYEDLWGHLQAAALGPSESAGFIGRMAEEPDPR